MERDVVRLECLKLVHRHDLSEIELISRAKALENYVLSDEPKPHSADKAMKPVIKKSGNATVLS